MIHGSLAVHHLSIVVLWQLTLGYYGSRHWITPVELKAITDSGFGQLLCAGLEQPTFIALLLHRFGASLETKSRAFEIAWVSFAITKSLAFLYTVVALVVNWSTAPMGWNVVMITMCCGITLTQVQSTKVLRQLSKRMQSQWLSSSASSLRNSVQMMAVP